jgi:hypothetical protein
MMIYIEANGGAADNQTNEEAVTETMQKQKYSRQAIKGFVCP